jgi:hypothetical protein
VLACDARDRTAPDCSVKAIINYANPTIRQILRHIAQRGSRAGVTGEPDEGELSQDHVLVDDIDEDLIGSSP